MGLWVLMNLASVFYKLYSYLLHPLLFNTRITGGWAHIPSLPQVACNFKLLMKVDPRRYYAFEVEQLKSR